MDVLVAKRKGKLLVGYETWTRECWNPDDRERNSGRREAQSHLELTMAPRGPALDARMTWGKQYCTARHVYQIEELSVINVEATTYRLRLDCRA
jgi:hypothetical protein